VDVVAVVVVVAATARKRVARHSRNKITLY
jgi:hypothetical protein